MVATLEKTRTAPARPALMASAFLPPSRPVEVACNHGPRCEACALKARVLEAARS